MHYDINWLTTKVEQGENLKFIYFWGHTNKLSAVAGNFCFSQWYEAPFYVDGKLYRTSEHWMMAQKALLFNDKATFDEILVAEKPAVAKELGRRVMGFDEIVWNEKRFEIVKTGNVHKFNQNPAFADYLIKTGNAVLVEASPVDIIWGIGLSKDSKDINNIYGWRGLNLLGFVLMEVRDFLRDFGSFMSIEDSMQTPWAKFPQANYNDMFWKMGEGENYILQFSNYYDTLSEKQQIIYKLTNPAPHSWDGFYS
ncbi:MAG TPA: NADAR family protein [Chitinophagales bacterium]|nr:NADAR family protein [Chitinophagales bacterium]